MVQVFTGTPHCTGAGWMIPPAQEWQPLSSVLELKKYLFSALDQRQLASVSFCGENSRLIIKVTHACSSSEFQVTEL